MLHNIKECPNCGIGNTMVRDVRVQTDIDGVGRLIRCRKCKSCGYAFNTIEIMQKDFDFICKSRDKAEKKKETLLYFLYQAYQQYNKKYPNDR